MRNKTPIQFKFPIRRLCVLLIAIAAALAVFRWKDADVASRFAKWRIESLGGHLGRRNGIPEGTIVFQRSANTSAITWLQYLDEVDSITLIDLEIDAALMAAISKVSTIRQLEMTDCRISLVDVVECPHIDSVILNAYTTDASLWPTIGRCFSHVESLVTRGNCATVDGLRMSQMPFSSQLTMLELRDCQVRHWPEFGRLPALSKLTLLLKVDRCNLRFIGELSQLTHLDLLLLHGQEFPMIALAGCENLETLHIANEISQRQYEEFAENLRSHGITAKLSAIVKEGTKDL